MMRDKITRFLSVSVAGLTILCAAVFIFLARYMNRTSAQTIHDVGTIYMTGMNERISMHFHTTIEQRLSQVENLLEFYGEDTEDKGAVNDRLAYGAKARGFESLAFCSDDGQFDMLYGKAIKITDPEPFMRSLGAQEKKVAVGTDADGKNMVYLGIPAGYVMSDGEMSRALVAGLPVDYISEMLALDKSNTLVYSHIIRKDGSFVIRSGEAFRQSYFQRIKAIVEEAGGSNGDMYVEELSAAMAADQDYSQVLAIGGERRHLYCAKLPYSEWYLVTIMPYDTLNDTVGRLNRQWGVMVFVSCGIVLLSLLAVFVRYFKMTRMQLKEVEQARHEAVEANKAKSEFLSNMSHDIRTPMNAIVGMTAIAIANADNQAQVHNCLRKIAMSSKHLLGLINDVLDMSKIESGKMTLNMDQVSLREAMDGIVSIVQPQVKAKSQSFDVRIHDISAENVCCDSVRLNQILLNLLSNAIKFTPEKGSISLSLWQEPSPRGSDYTRCHIEVADNGIGMAPDFKDKIFESFVREDRARVHKTEGTGLGLAITKYIVDAMEGTIEVESQQGHGSRFCVILDLEEAVIQEVDMVLPSWSMLVVDDDHMLCQNAVSILKSIGVEAEWTMDGETALERIEERHNKNQDYQIVLIDWKLPGIDGIETARRITKRLKKDIPIILISAYDWNDIEEEARAAGISGFISKPLFKSTLFYSLREYMGMAKRDGEEKSDKELNGRKILVAEDNELNWEIASELLSELGLDLDWAENGQICVDKFESSAPGYYDAVLMDLRMPVMTGYEAADAIRKMDRPDADIPIIAMTADAFAEDIKRCLEHGMNAHMAKPIDVAETARMLRKFIR